MGEVEKPMEELPHGFAAGKQRDAVQGADPQTDPKKDLQNEPVKRKHYGTDQVLNGSIPKAAGHYKRMAVMFENCRLLALVQRAAKLGGLVFHLRQDVFRKFPKDVVLFPPRQEEFHGS